MDIAIVAPTANDDSFLIPPNSEVRGYAAFACLFPEDKTFNVSPNGFEKIADKVDIVMFIPGADPVFIKQMIEIAITFSGKTLVQDSDPPTGWLDWFPLVTIDTLKLFDVCDVVVTHGESMVDVIQCLTQTPVAHLAEPSYLASYKKSTPHGHLVLSVTTHCATYNSNRNAMVNYAILNQLNDIDGYSIGVIQNKMEADAGDMHIKEYEILKQIGFDAHFRIPYAPNRYKMFQLFERLGLMINMDYTNSIGHWQIDAAAMGVPMVCTSFPDASQRLFPELCFSPYDVTAAAAAAKRILTDSAYRKHILDYAFEAVDFYSFEQTRNRLCDIIGIDKPSVCKPEIDESVPIVLELGSGGNLHADVTHALDSRDFSDVLEGKTFVQHNLMDLPLPFEADSCSRVYLSHVLEHLPRHCAVALMEDVYRLLAHGGTVNIGVTNVSKAFDYGAKLYPDIEKEMHGEIAWLSVTKTLWADSSEYPENQHCYGWNHFTLERMLKDEVGFEIFSVNDPTTWAVIIEAVKHGN